MSELFAPPDVGRNKCHDSAVALDAAQSVVEHMCEDLGLDDLSAVDVLDVGCGFRFTQVFLGRGVPIGHYVGVDVEPKIIDFLRANVDDPRFEYYRLNGHNERYNPDGVALADLDIPELEGRRFDVICLFSVFTHLAPHDYVAMLRLLRRYVDVNSTLFYTLFVNEQSEGGYGYVDALARRVAEADSTKPPPPPGLAEALRRHRQVPDFVDAEPATPLMVALYSRAHALELVTGTGWKVTSLRPPDLHLQHHMICKPVT